MGNGKSKSPSGVNEADLKNAWSKGGSKEAIAFLTDHRDSWKSQHIHIAIVGHSGAGKSTTINTLRGLKRDHPDACMVDEVQATRDIRAYPHPENAKLLFYDIPGSGTPEFPRETYLHQIGFDKYDFFLIMCSSRFSEDDVWLAKVITQRRRQFYYVRSHIDVAISSNQQTKDVPDSPETVMNRIRFDIVDGLNRGGHTNVDIFLINSNKAAAYEFPALRNAIASNIDEKKRLAYLYSMQADTKEMVDMKVKLLKDYSMIVAAASGLVALAPVPGVSVATDVAMVSSAVGFFYNQLGLTKSSSVKLGNKLDMNSDEAMLFQGVVNGKTLVALGKIVALVGSEVAAAMGAEEVFRFIPFVGSVIAGVLSCGTTYLLLKFILEQMGHLAKEELLEVGGNSLDTTDNTELK